MSIKREYNFDQVGDKDMYLLHHEEIESLAKNIPEAKRIRFFMTFGQSYLDHMRCLEDVGMLSTTPVNFNGQEIVPIQFLKALLPDPASLGPRTKGKTNIGCIFTGKKDGKEKTYYIYNVCDHQECYKEVGSQAISYTTGVPAMCGALMLLTGKWTTKGVHTVKSLIRTRIWTLWTSTACPAPRATARRWWTDAAGRYPPALCGPCKPFLGSACLSAHPLLPAGRRQLRRNGELLLGVQQRTGCKILLAQKAFSNFNVYPVLAPYLAGTEPAACTRAALAKKSCRKKRTMCSARPTGQTSSRSCCNTPTTSCSIRPASWQSSARQQRAAGKSVGLRLNPECSTQEGHAIYDPCAPAAALAPPAPSGMPPCRQTRPCPNYWTDCTSTPCASRMPMHWP